MPKTYNNLWSNLVSFENLYAAYHVARSGHREHMEVHKFEKNLEENLINIQNHLIWHSWTPDPFLEFVVHEPKERRIQAPTFRDRVVHHAYYQIVGPLFEKKFISHTYACIPGRGPLKAAEKAHEYIRSFPKGKRVYVIYGDMKGYFPSIDHAYLKEQTRRTIKDPDVLWLGDTLIDANGLETGLGIGALPSQLYAGVNLDPFDHYMKDDLGVKRYIRYMDDWVVISDDKQYLERILVLAKDFLTGNPRLVINPKTRIIPITHGLDYCGYRIFRDYLLPRKRNLKRAKKRIYSLNERYQAGTIPYSKLKSSIMSLLGYASHCRAYKSVDSILGGLVIRHPEVSYEDTLDLLWWQTTTGSSHPSYDSGAQALL